MTDDEDEMRRLTAEHVAKLPELAQEAIDATVATHALRPAGEVLAELVEQLRRRGVQGNPDSENLRGQAQAISDGDVPRVTGVRRSDGSDL